MVAANMTLENAVGELRPFLSDDFLRAWRRVTMALGYRTVGKAITTIKPNGAKAATSLTATVNDHIMPKLQRCPDCERKAQRKLYARPNRRWTKAEMREYAWGEWRHYVDTRFKGPDGYIAACEARGDFRWRSYLRKPSEMRVHDLTSGRLGLYSPKKCCGEPMGIMESWDGTTAVYQCAVNIKHTEPATPKPSRYAVKPGIDYGLKAAK